ncbi:GAF domain-containing sensor histidine kinase [Capillimicrobium parvum]|uniref:histidine kinase n=1 Tax=Capillimicrobium parvum TaxID=2884022 RepID=A0A9E6XTW8_9ACTN|nr:GAF domain-containing protein [Capillimicrobium parvum]UGS34412.1 Oxygen sensor histidine kinase response regulator DevS/DosS [Capillimicrobium parvum]
MLEEARLRRVVDVSRTVVSELDLETVLQRVLEEARELTGARYAALGILDEERRQLERFLTIGIDPEAHGAIGDLPRGRGVLGVLIRDPKPLRLDDVGEHARSYGFPLGHPPMGSFLGVPILVRGEAWGNLYLTDKQGAAGFDEADEEAIVLLAGWAGVAIDNARAYSNEHARRAELEHAVNAMEATAAIARAVGGETDLNRVLELVVKRARALVDARGMLILLAVGDELEVTAVAGRLAPDLPGTRVPLEGSVSGSVMSSGRSMRLHNLSEQLRFTLADRIDATTGLMVPLQFRGRRLGVLAAFDRGEREEFTAEDEHLLESFAASAATAVATAQNVAAQGLRRSIEASERERQRWARELHDETLQSLAGLKVMLSGARRQQDPETVGRVLETAVDQIGDAIAALRRLITDLRPAALDEFGTAAALEGLVERVGQTSGLNINLHADLAYEQGRAESRHPAVVEDAVYRIVQEALTNVVKHARATKVTVTVVEDEHGAIRLAVADDGVGIGGTAGDDARERHEGFGLVGMRERVDLVHGTLSVEPGERGGTVVRAFLPPSDQVVQAVAG